jgi:hypothetical protein
MTYKTEFLPRARRELFEAGTGTMTDGVDWVTDSCGRLKKKCSKSRKRRNGMQNEKEVFERQKLGFSHI